MMGCACCGAVLAVGDGPRDLARDGVEQQRQQVVAPVGAQPVEERVARAPHALEQPRVVELAREGLEAVDLTGGQPRAEGAPVQQVGEGGQHRVGEDDRHALVVERLDEARRPLAEAAAHRAEASAHHARGVLLCGHGASHEDLRVGVLAQLLHELHARVVVPPGIEEQQRSRRAVARHGRQRLGEGRAGEVDVGRGDADVLGRVEARQRRARP